MSQRLTAAFAALLIGCAWAGDADARPFRPNLIPNGSENSCSNCHVSPGGGGTRTAFGEDVRANVSVNGMEFFWPDVCDLDSDGDGVTNGEELGDPCCVWDRDDPSRTTDISLPGDETSTTTNPTGPDEDGDGISNACDPDYVPPVEMDMGSGAPDIGSGDPDMGSANNTPGNNSTPDMGAGGGSDMGSDEMPLDDDSGCGCSSAPGTTATPWLLAFALCFSRLRRRR